MQKVLIVGAGGFGREVLQWVREHPAHGKDWEVSGFLDDRRDALDGYDTDGVVWVGTISEHAPEPDELLLCALGEPKVRRDVALQLLAKGGKFLTLIHPSALIGRNVRIGEGAIVCPRVTLTCDITLGAGVVLNIGVSVGHDAQIGDWCTISGHCDITGYARLGEGVFMGTHAAVLPSVEVGAWARIGAGAVAYQNIKEKAVVAQMPPRQIG